jgi:hypothetical protein
MTMAPDTHAPANIHPDALVPWCDAPRTTRTPGRMDTSPPEPEAPPLVCWGSFALGALLATPAGIAFATLAMSALR